MIDTISEFIVEWKSWRSAQLSLVIHNQIQNKSVRKIKITVPSLSPKSVKALKMEPERLWTRGFVEQMVMYRNDMYRSVYYRRSVQKPKRRWKSAKDGEKRRKTAK